ncbi:lysophospholipid acyltransferase family protein [Prosthecochloris vibrioformis]|uniref:Glycerol acyltransferase n=1 Tax=Prosthecochloris vibrioformis TaxID=1098 RepID=A0A5C4S1T5_PROVB|nr:lysophospholipid acyltransferase family protein [Prosthecochloris vibrioformis]TNJ37420.1 glycerol acyltransferase [Prosthecochloris vibrioformis]
MLRVRRSWLTTRWFAWYSRRLFRRHFTTLRVAMSPELRAMDRRYPVIFYGNHAYWWDGFWSQLCTEELFHNSQNLHIIIGEPELRKHRFFTRLGAFSIDRQNPRSAVESVNYAADILSHTPHNGRQQALWLFPQGRIEHVDRRPLGFYQGTAAIIERTLRKKEALSAVSVVSRIEYLEEQKPELLLSFGKPELHRSGEGSISKKELTQAMESTTAQHLDRLRDEVMERNLHRYQILLEGTPSINRRMESGGGK